MVTSSLTTPKPRLIAASVRRFGQFPTGIGFHHVGHEAVGSRNVFAVLLTRIRRFPLAHICFNAAASNGSFRKRLPVAAKIALVTTGTIPEVPGSPMPPGGSELWMM